MASAAPSGSEAPGELTCPICLDAYRCPCTLSCGHSFCLECVEGAWDAVESFSCPQCRVTFPQRPKLNKTLTLANLVEQRSAAEKMVTVVLCDFCNDGTTAASKTCLRCDMSYCVTHVKPHQETPKFRDHILVDPGTNPEDRNCKMHRKKITFYCRQDKKLVRTTCTIAGDHKGHDVATLEDEHKTREQLDISELNAVGAGREAKRRKKAPEEEQGEKVAKDEAAVNPVTPDYAAGLVSTPKLGALSNDSSMPSTSYLPATPIMIPSSSYNPSTDAPSGAGGAAAIRDALQSNRTPEEPPSSPTVPVLQSPFKQRAPLYSSGLPSSAAAPAASPSPTTPQPTTPNLAQASTSQQLPVPVPQPPTATTTSTATTTVAQQQQQKTQQSQPKKNLSLTRELLFAAIELFRTANKVARPEKALILGFMAGSRENPCPDQGDIVQIKLSEHTEVRPKADGTGSTTMLVDTVFEMNYATGQWTRFKKYKPITNTS